MRVSNPSLLVWKERGDGDLWNWMKKSKTETMCLTMRTEFCHLAITASVSNSQNLLLESVFLFSLAAERAPYSVAEPSSAGSQHQG